MQKTDKTIEEHGKRRREFLTKSAKIAVTVPAASLLIAHANDAKAGGGYLLVSGACIHSDTGQFDPECEPT